MSKDVLTPRQVPQKLSEEWLGDAEQWVNPLAPAIRHAELERQRKRVLQIALALLTLAIGIAAGTVLHMFGSVLACWIATGIAFCLAVFVGSFALRLAIRSHLAYQEANIAQQAACGAIRVVRSPDDPRPAKLDATGNIIEEPT